jgi:glycosyltransferase involved in cell wall biosynthesis
MMSNSVTRICDAHPRLLWIVNHKTLLPAEVPILRSLGYSVFIPKRVPSVPDYRSAVVEYGYDVDLKIPNDALAVLNLHNFYEREWSPTLALILNKYFEVLVTSVSAYTAPLFEAVRKFNGGVVARVFGREHPQRYTSFFEMSGDTTLLQRVKAMGNRFIFGQGFNNLAQIEDFRLSDRARTVTVAVPDRIWKKRNSWTGGEQKVLLLCPNIRDSGYYRAIYSDLKNTFGTLPHSIFGRQNIPPDDPAVLPYMTDNELLELYGRAMVFAYPSVETRHVHYSPIEAMIVGTPVLYRSGGMLDHLAAQRLPGCCDSNEEMREKARWLLSGDTKVQRAIQESQEKIAERFSTDVAQREWAQVLAECCPNSSKVSGPVDLK